MRESRNVFEGGNPAPFHLWRSLASCYSTSLQHNGPDALLALITGDERCSFHEIHAHTHPRALRPQPTRDCMNMGITVPPLSRFKQNKKSVHVHLVNLFIWYLIFPPPRPPPPGNTTLGTWNCEEPKSLPPPPHPPCISCSVQQVVSRTMVRPSFNISTILTII